MQPDTKISTELQGDVAAGLVSLNASVTATPLPAATPVAPAPSSGSRWVPTMADFVYLSLIVWMFIAGPKGWASLLADGDTGWHIRVGDWIRDHGAFPRQDFLSFPKAGEAWYAWEWGAEVFMSYLHSLAGLKGVVLALGMMIPTYLLIVLRHAMWRGAAPLIVLPVLLLISGSSAIHYLARPHLFTLLFLAGSLWLIEADRRAPSAQIWLLIPLTVLWANIHGGFFSLVACLGLVAVGSALSRNLRMAKRYALLAAGCLAASLVNPYGYHLHEHIVSYLRSDWIKDAVDEFQSPKFRSEAMFMYEGVMMATFVCVYRLIRRREWVDTLLVVAWAHLSLGSVRHIPIFLLVASPVLAAELSAWWKEILPGLPKRAIGRTFATLSADLEAGFLRNSVWVIAPVFLLAILDRPIAWPKTFPDDRFPVAMVERHRAELEGKRVLAPDEWGDYLSYRFYPNQRVFFDGRSDFLGEELGKAYLALMQGGVGAQKQLERFQFDTVFVPKDWPIQETLRNDSKWELVAEEDKNVLLRRRVEPQVKKF